MSGIRWIALLAASAGVIAWLAVRQPAERLPGQIAVDDVLRDLTTLDGTRAQGPAPGAAARLDWVQTNTRLDGKGEHRQALVTPPAAVVERVLAVPAGTVLTFAIGVGRPADATPPALDGAQPAAASAAPAAVPAPGARFLLTINGETVFDRTLDPARNGKKEDRWVAQRIDLARWAGTDATLAFRADALATDAAPVPAWSRLRLVRPARYARQAASSSAPSVLVLLADSLRADAVGAYGGTPSMSPTVDGLAARGVRFEEVVAQAPWTLPAVATLFTGLHPQSHGLIGGQWRRGPTHDPAFAGRFFLADGIPTLAELAQRAGITTVGVTANNLISFTTNVARGFEVWKEPPGKRTGTRFPRGELINEIFTEWLAAHRGLRFFGYLHYMDTHSPYTPPDRYLPPDDPRLPADVRAGETEPYLGKTNALSRDAVAHLWARYRAGLRYWDDRVADVLAALEAHGLADSTIVVVVSDHGEGFQEHGYVGHCVHLHDELIRIPWIIAGPGVPAGTRHPTQVQGIDVLPTIAALLGVTPPEGLPGQNVLAPHTPQPALAHTALWRASDSDRDELVALREPAWKVIHQPTTRAWELFDLATDPGETTNQFATRADAGAFAAQLTQRHTSLPRRAATIAAAPQSPGLRDRLSVLGYIE